MNPRNFISNSDYTTLKNDNKSTLTLVIGNSPVIAVGGTYTYETTAVVGTLNAGVRSQMKTSLAYDIWSSCVLPITLRATLNTGGGVVVDWYTNAIVERSTSGTVRLFVNIQNPYAFTMQITGGGQTITADVVTFLSPFN